MAEVKYIRTKPANFHYRSFTTDLYTSVIGPYVQRITSIENELHIVFSQSIDETILNDLISNNQPPDPYLEINDYPDLNVNGGVETHTTNSEYTQVKVFIYPGKSKTGYPGEIHLIATIDEGVTNGCVRVYDISNRKVIADMTNITCQTPMILNMTFTNENLPVNRSELAIQLKRTSIDPTKKITFHSLLFDFS